MTVIDLSHPLSPETPLYPGTPPITLDPGHTVVNDGFLEHRLAINTHVGTHVDAPAHLLPDGATLDDLPVGSFLGPAAIVDTGPLADGRVTTAWLESQAARLEGADFVLLRTGWSRFWGDQTYLGDFPCLSTGAAAWLAARGLRGVGVDTISVDPMGDAELAVHHTLLGRGLVIVENLTNLAAVPDQPFQFSALPLPLAGGDGSPVRAVAVL